MWLLICTSYSISTCLSAFNSFQWITVMDIVVRLCTSRPEPTPAERMEKAFNRLKNSKDCKSLLKKYLTDDVYKKLRAKKTQLGATLLDCVQSGEK